MSSRELAIKLTGVTKKYRLRHEKPTFFENVINYKKEKQVFAALNNVDLEINKGEKIGIIGSNGSGKTTLLKVITGISTPTEGKVITWGKIVSLIDLGAGFHPELTGEENIFLNAILVGMGTEEVRSKFREIVKFADIDGFIDTPLYTYSSGMKLRLGFSIAVASNPDILILDEGIAVGDIDFQKKSTDKIEQFYKEKKTILIVSHWLEYLMEHSGRIIRMENGKIVDDGQPEKIIKEYARAVLWGKSKEYFESRFGKTTELRDV